MASEFEQDIASMHSYVNLIENATQPIQVKKYLDKLTVLGEKILERKEHVYCPLQFRNYFMDMENKS